jgi:hypothetical protein
MLRDQLMQRRDPGQALRQPRRASTRPDSSSISMSWWASAQSSPINSTAPPHSELINKPRTAEKTCYDLMDQCSTGTTSHQHYRPPHQPPGHDLVIDLTKARHNGVLTDSRSGQQHAGSLLLQSH